MRSSDTALRKFQSTALSAMLPDTCGGRSPKSRTYPEVFVIAILSVEHNRLFCVERKGQYCCSRDECYLLLSIGEISDRRGRNSCSGIKAPQFLATCSIQGNHAGVISPENQPAVGGQQPAHHNAGL